MAIRYRKRQNFGKIDNVLQIVGFPTADLEGYWKFDSDSDDSTASGYDGTDTDISYATSGKISNCATFNGSTSKIALGDVLGTVLLGAWTINCRVYLDNYTGYNSIFSKTTGGIPKPLDIWTAPTTGKISVLIGSNASPTNFTPTAAFGTGVWKMLTITYDGSDTAAGIDVFFNSVSQAGSGGNGSAGANSTDSCNFGMRNDSFTKLDGGLDEFGIWSRVLTQTEITTLYNGGDGLTY